MQHDIKIDPQFFTPVATRQKPYEVRKNDRDYKVGDTLNLLEYDRKLEQYTGRRILARVTYLVQGGDYGIAAGYVVLTVAIIQVVKFAD